VLIVDDEEAIRDGCRQALEKEGITVLEASNGPDALSMLKKTRCEVLLLDLKMPGMGGMETLQRLREHGNPTVIVITGYPSVGTAVDAMKWGAVDYLTKPFSAEDLRVAVSRALARESLEQAEPQARPEREREEASSSDLLGQTPQIKAIRALVGQVAATDSTVLVMGESGTGKEVVARMLHEESGRSGGPFVLVDCTTLVDALVENELFGHMKGSYTGATSTTSGRFELAQGGTLFLDEVGCLHLGLQSKLLRAIERGEFMRVGCNETISVDVRVVAATNTDLARAVEEGTFREDLYYRLSVVPIVLPPLRQRKADIPPLAGHFLKMHAAAHHKHVTRISQEAVNVLVAHDWPGNVRELSNAIERAVVLAEGDEIVPELLLHYGFALSPVTFSSRSENKSLADLEAGHIRRILRRTGGNKTRAAELLGIDRKTLWRKLREHEEKD